MPECFRYDVIHDLIRKVQLYAAVYNFRNGKQVLNQSRQPLCIVINVRKNLLDVYKRQVYRFCEKSIILNRGQVAMKGETRAIFQKPENVTAARLTGCKNFSRIRRIGEYEVEALDWGLTFQTEEAVAAEHAYIGIRAHQFYPARGSANEFTCEWGDTPVSYTHLNEW